MYDTYVHVNDVNTYIYNIYMHHHIGERQATLAIEYPQISVCLDGTCAGINRALTNRNQRTNISLTHDTCITSCLGPA